MGIITKKIGTAGAGRDYSLLQSWEDALPANLVTDGNSQVAELYADSEFVSTSEALIISGETTDAAHTITVKCAAGQSFKDHPNRLTNRLTYNSAYGVAIRSSRAYTYTVYTDVANVFFDGLQIKNTSGIAQALQAVNSSVITNCVLWTSIGSSSPVVYTRGTGSKLINCLVVNDSTASGAGQAIGGAYNLLVENCTIVRPSNRPTASTSTSTAYGTHTVKNCAVFGFLGPSTSTTADGHNVTDYTSAAGTTGNQVSKTYANQFVNSSTASGLEDFRPKAGSDLIGAGIRDAAVTSDLDIIGQARSTSTPTVGAWEYQTAGGAAQLAGAAAATSSGLGALTTSVRLACDAASAATATGALSTVIALTGASSSTGMATASLTTAIRLGGAAGAAAAGTGAVSTEIPLAGSAAGVAAGSGALTTATFLGGGATACATASAALTAPGPGLAGAAFGAASGAGALSTSIRLSGAVSAVVSGTAAFSGSAPALLGTATCGASASGALATGISLIAVDGAQVFAAGRLTTAIRLGGVAASTAFASGVLTSDVGTVQYVRAPTGAGYTPRGECQQHRPSDAAHRRPADTQRNHR